MATLTYPSGRVVTYTPDTAGRPSNIEDNTTSVYYATGTCTNGVSGNGVCYAPQGGVALLQNSSELVTTHIYNNRLQPCWTYSTTGTALAWGNTINCASNESTAGNMFDQKYNFNLGSDNGTLVSMTNNRVTDRSQTFSYDQLNRVSTAQTTATYSSDAAHCWGQIFGFDSTGDWSNLLSIGGVSSAYTGCSQGTLSVVVNANNQITTDTYDAAGNLWVIPGTGGATYLYNAENQMTSTSNSSINYIYHGDGNRVEKSSTKIYWYAGSEVLDETDTTGSVTNSSFNEYVFFGGNRIARRDSSGDVFYYLVDQVDSSRVIAEVPSGQTTATMCYDGDFEPYGGEHAYINTCSKNYKFTGKERDSESDLDNFGARYYASTTGRFMSPDWALKPISVPYANFGDPQTLNLYTYVENSPLNRIDADGHAGSGSLSSSSASCGNVSAGDGVCVGNVGGGRYVVDAGDRGGEDDAPTVEGDPAQFGQAQNNQQTRDDIAKTANKYKDSTDWAYDKKKGAFGCNTWKCNQFVGDVVKEAGAPAEVNGRYPTAGEWADKKTKIGNWRVLGADEKPQAGDVAAYKIPGCHGCTGHSGIVVGVDSQGVHAMAAHYDVVGPDNKFQPSNSAVVYRRYTGDEQ